MVLGLFWWAGCGAPTGKPSAPPPTDTVDSAVDTSIDSGSPPDTGHAPVLLAGTIVLPENAVDVGPIWVGAAQLAFQSDTVVFGSTLDAVEADASGAFALTLPARPPTSALSALAPSDFPELAGALYMLTAFSPSSTGGTSFYEGLPIRGMAFHRLLVWLDPSTVEGSGWPGGWSLVDTGLEGTHGGPACLIGTTQPLKWRWADGYPYFYAVDEAPLEVPLRGVPVSLSMGGRTVGDLGDIDRLAGVPLQVATGESTELEPVVDLSLDEGTFSATLSEPPPSTHDLGGDPAWQVTLAYLLQYTDQGATGWTLAEDAETTTSRSACWEGRPVYVRYTRAVSTWRGARLLDCQNSQVGWRLVSVDEAGGSYRALSNEASVDLTVQADCAY